MGSSQVPEAIGIVLLHFLAVPEMHEHGNDHHCIQCLCHTRNPAEHMTRAPSCASHADIHQHEPYTPRPQKLTKLRCIWNERAGNGLHGLVRHYLLPPATGVHACGHVTAANDATGISVGHRSATSCWW